MTPDNPHDALRKVQAELADLSARLAYLAESVRTVSAALPSDTRPVDLAVGPVTWAAQDGRGGSSGPAGGPPNPTDPRPYAPQPTGIGGQAAGYAPPAHPPQYPRTPQFAPAPPSGPRLTMSAVPATPRQRRRPRVSVAEAFAVVGSAITLIGVTFVLVLPQDGVLGPFSRVGIAVALAVAAIAAIRDDAWTPIAYPRRSMTLTPAGGSAALRSPKFSSPRSRPDPRPSNSLDGWWSAGSST